MKFPLYFSRLAVAGLLLGGVSTTASADWSDPAGLGRCPENFTGVATPEACTLPIHNADFELGAMGGWLGFNAADGAYGLNLVGPARDGDGYAAVLRHADQGIQQEVPLPRNVGEVGGEEAAYVTRFRVTSDGNAPVTLRYRLRLLDAEGAPVGRIAEGDVATDGSDYVHAVRHPVRPLPDGGRLVIELIRGSDEAQGFAAYVDDVSVIVRERK